MKKLLLSLLLLVVVLSVFASATPQCGDPEDQASIECPHHDVPEFTGIGAGLALFGAGAYALFRSRK